MLTTYIENYTFPILLLKTIVPDPLKIGKNMFIFSSHI